MADDEFLSDDDWFLVPLKEVARHELHPLGTKDRIAALEAELAAARNLLTCTLDGTSDWLREQIAAFLKPTQSTPVTASETRGVE
jgi:hypothetical protein